MRSYAKEIAPTEPGWCAVCMRVDPDFTDQFPFCPPEVIWYDGKNEDIIFDLKGSGGGGISGIDEVMWWGKKVPDKPEPEFT